MFQFGMTKLFLYFRDVEPLELLISDESAGIGIAIILTCIACSKNIRITCIPKILYIVDQFKRYEHGIVVIPSAKYVICQIHLINHKLLQ